MISHTQCHQIITQHHNGEITMTKLTLADHLRLRLAEEHGSYKNASNFYNISYENLKSSIARNIFGEHIINVLFPEVSLDNLQKKYDFQVARIYRPKLGEGIVKRKNCLTY